MLYNITLGKKHMGGQFHGGGSLLPLRSFLLNYCLCAPTLSSDVSLVQLHTQVHLLSASLMGEEFWIHSRPALVVWFLAIVEVHSEWLHNDIEVLGSRLGVGGLVSVVVASAALPVLWELVAMFYAVRLTC